MTTKAKSEKTTATTAPLGAVVPASSVVRPDGTKLEVSGTYVLDVPGVHVVDGEEVVCK